MFVLFFQAEDGIRDLVRSRGLGDVYKRQALSCIIVRFEPGQIKAVGHNDHFFSSVAAPYMNLSLIHI